MSWCPMCKNEYEQGIKICVDCGCELTEGVQEKCVPITFGTEEEMKALKDFLVYSGISSATLIYTEEDDCYELQAAETEKKQSVRLIEIFLQQTAMEEAGKEAEAKKKEADAAAYLYQNNADRAEENRSSAYTLLGVGSIGLLVMILGMTGILPLLQGTNRYMVYGVMSALFMLFIVMGAVSMKSSRIFAKKAESENSLRNTMEKWCRENLNGDKLDMEAFAGEQEELTDELKYFKRVEIVKKKIQTQFMNLDSGFLEQFADEIYGGIFEE